MTDPIGGLRRYLAELFPDDEGDVQEEPQEFGAEPVGQWAERIRERTIVSLKWVVAGAVAKDEARRSADQVAQLQSELVEIERALKEAAGEEPKLDP